MRKIKNQYRIEVFKKAIQNGCQILTYDIETSHMLVRTFYIGNKVNISHKQVKVPSKVISIQYMFQNMKKAKYLAWDKINSFGDVRDFDDSSMLTEFVTNLYSPADIVITQNGDKFDWPTINYRLKLNKLTSLEKKPSLDILKLSRSSFRTPSHKLDYRSEEVGLGGKLPMEDKDWIDIEENGVPVSKKMAPYGCKDTLDTYQLFWKELPYYKSLPCNVTRIILDFAFPETNYGLCMSHATSSRRALNLHQPCYICTVEPYTYA